MSAYTVWFIVVLIGGFLNALADEYKILKNLGSYNLGFFFGSIAMIVILVAEGKLM